MSEGGPVTLLIFEGDSTEKKIHNNLRRTILVSDDSNRAYYRGNIFDLLAKLQQDPFFDPDDKGSTYDVLPLLQERPDTPKEIRGLKRSQIGYIYLFFDHDYHAGIDRDTPDQSFGKLMQPVDFFDNETESGKLYLSYPMVEAVKDMNRQQDMPYPCLYPANDNGAYKGIVGQRGRHA